MPPAKTFSLKSALTQQPKQEVKDVHAEADNKVFTQEELETAWEALVLHVSANPKMVRLANSLRTSQPTLKDVTTIAFAVMNEVQKDWLMKNMAGEILSFLGEKLHNQALSLNISVVEKLPEEAKNQLYMPDEKLRYLVEKYPMVQKLKQAINLDVK